MNTVQATGSAAIHVQITSHIQVREDATLHKINARVRRAIINARVETRFYKVRLK